MKTINKIKNIKKNSSEKNEIILSDASKSNAYQEYYYEPLANALGYSPDDLQNKIKNNSADVTDRAFNLIPHLHTLSSSILKTTEEFQLINKSDSADAKDLEDSIREIIFNKKAAAPDSTNVNIQELAKLIINDLDNVNQNLREQGQKELSEIQRQSEAVKSVAKWGGNPFRNEGTNTFSRYAGNTLSVGVKVGIATFVATYVRNIVAFDMQQTINAAKVFAANKTTGNGTMANSTMAGTMANSTMTGTVAAAKVAADAMENIWSTEEATKLLNGVGISMLGLMVVLQVTGAIRDISSGAATKTSIAMRAINTLTAGVTVAIAVKEGAWNPLATLIAMVSTYSVVRGVISAGMPIQSNVTSVAKQALVSATAAYSSAQAIGNYVQGTTKLNAGVSASGISTKNNTAKQIANAERPHQLNAAHSSLNAALEIFDELQFSSICRAYNQSTAAAAMAKLGPDTMAQMQAAAMRGMLWAAGDTGASDNALISAGVASIQNYKNIETEGLRLSMSRSPVSQEKRLDCVTKAVTTLETLGYKYSHKATEKTPEDQRNRFIAAFVSQELIQLELNQPLEAIEQFKTVEGLMRLGQRFKGPQADY